MKSCRPLPTLSSPWVWSNHNPIPPSILKYGEQFIYVRRYKTEFKKLKLFFDDIRHEFPNVKLEVKGKTFFINEKVAGYSIALSTSQSEKSTAYPNVGTILFDEFIVDKSYIRYLPNEVEIFLDLYETVARFRENVKAYFLANKVTLVNPYFKYFDCIPKKENRFSTFKDGEIVVEQFTSESFIEMKKKTRIFENGRGSEQRLLSNCH